MEMHELDFTDGFDIENETLKFFVGKYLANFRIRVSVEQDLKTAKENLHKRWAEFCLKKSWLMREISNMGYKGVDYIDIQDMTKKIRHDEMELWELRAQVYILEEFGVQLENPLKLPPCLQ